LYLILKAKMIDANTNVTPFAAINSVILDVPAVDQPQKYADHKHGVHTQRDAGSILCFDDLPSLRNKKTM
jgi:hypothetical protein